MRPHILAFVLVTAACGKKGSDSPAPPPPAIKPPVDSGWTFESTPMWSDEFDTDGAPDPARWGYDIGGSGWGNHELQYYTDNINNAYIEDGKLKITAIKEPIGGRNYTSARLVSRTKGDFLYGRIEVRAKLPRGRGTWPAIWMLPTDWAYGNWPKSGEIDIMEHVGYDSNRVHFSVHTEAYNHSIGTQKTSNRVLSTAMTEFHTYRCDWTPYAVRGYIDDQMMFFFVNEGKGSAVWPFDKRFHLLLNIAVGGNWGGVQGVDDSVFPATMEIDYVRVYKMKQP
jgi:beta-glucanase (GH16 family)